MPSYFSKWLSNISESITSTLLSSISEKLQKRRLKAALSYFLDLNEAEPVWLGSNGGLKVEEASLNVQNITNALSEFPICLSYGKVTSLNVQVKKQKNFQPAMHFSITSLEFEFHLTSEKMEAQTGDRFENTAAPVLRDILDHLLDMIELDIQDVKLYFVDLQNIAVLSHFTGVQYRPTVVTPDINDNSESPRRKLLYERVTVQTADLRNSAIVKNVAYETILSLGLEPLSVDFGEYQGRWKLSDSHTSKRSKKSRRKPLDISATCNILGCIRPEQIRGFFNLADHWNNAIQSKRPTSEQASSASIWTELGHFRIQVTCYKAVVFLLPNSSSDDPSNASLLEQYHRESISWNRSLSLSCSYTQLCAEELLATLQSNEHSEPKSMATTIKVSNIFVFNWKQDGPKEHIPIPIIILDSKLSGQYTSPHTNPRNLASTQRRANFPDLDVTDWTYTACRKRGVDLSKLRTIGTLNTGTSKSNEKRNSIGVSVSIVFEEDSSGQYSNIYCPAKVEISLQPLQVYFDLQYLLQNNEARMFVEYILEQYHTQGGRRTKQNVRIRKPSVDIQTDFLRLHIRCFPEVESEPTSGTLVFDIQNLFINRPKHVTSDASSTVETTLLQLQFDRVLAACTSVSEPPKASSFISTGKATSEASEQTPSVALIDSGSPELSLLVEIPSTDILITDSQLEELALISNDVNRVLGYSFHPAISVVDSEDTNGIVYSGSDGDGSTGQPITSAELGSAESGNAANLIVQDGALPMLLFL
ncbi:hypothetical protein BDQ17DRAFT_944225 [Cyathus striatus]|nr:hypothetical protein BDQ17DRAFT_944225 [Cyathus striatus]